MICVSRPIGWNYRAAIGNADVIENLVLAGLDVELDFYEARSERRHGRRAAELILCRADETAAGDTRHGGLSDRVQLLGHFLTGEPATKLDSALCRLRIRQKLVGLLCIEHPMVADIVIVGRTAEIRCRNLLELLQCILGGSPGRARHRERGVAAELTEIPWQVLVAAAAHDGAALPVTLEHLGCYA